MAILIVDDEVNIVNSLKDYLSCAGFECQTASNGQQAIDLLEVNEYDCVIMDIMMPVLDGYKALEIIREQYDIPVVMISAKCEENDKIKGFDLGADDYVTKPFSPREVLARIKSLLKRTKISVDFVVAGNIKIVFDTRQVICKDKVIELPRKQFDLLAYFIKYKKSVLTREKLLDGVWGWTYDKGERTVDTHIKMLRANLGESSNYIKTVRGVGYKFEE